MTEISPVQQPLPEAEVISAIVRGMFPDYYPSRSVVPDCRSPSSLMLDLPHLHPNIIREPPITTVSASSLGLDAMLLSLDKPLARLRYTIRSSIHLSLEEIIYQRNFTPTLSALKTAITSSCLYPILSSLFNHLSRVPNFPYPKIPLLISYLDGLFHGYWSERIRPIYQRFLSSLTVYHVKASRLEGVKWYESTVAKEGHINDVQILVLSTIAEDAIREKVVGVVKGIVERYFAREKNLKETIREVLGKLKQEKIKAEETVMERAVEA